jgi:hypothetical protein
MKLRCCYHTGSGGFIQDSYLSSTRIVITSRKSSLTHFLEKQLNPKQAVPFVSKLSLGLWTELINSQNLNLSKLLFILEILQTNMFLNTQCVEVIG